jgi:hypothetical protein
MPDYSEAKPMRLSEAIRLGAMLGPQSFDKFYDHKTQATCALGAAAQAVNTFLGEPLNAEQRYPWSVKIISAYCPKCGGKFKCAAEVIIHLNDAHHWSRTRIADLVEVLELNFSVQESEALSKKTDAFKAVIEKLPFAIKALAWLAGFAVFILPFSGFTSQFLVIFFLSGAILFLIDASCRFLRRTGAPQPEGGGAPQDFSTGHEVAGTALENITVHCPQCQAEFTAGAERL